MPTRQDLAKVDRERPKEGSNNDWNHPHAPDARITKMRDGRTRLAHRLDVGVDMSTGAVAGVMVQPPPRRAASCTPVTRTAGRATKAYMIALSEALDLTLQAAGVRPCAPCPGLTHTNFHAVAGLLEEKAALPGLVWYDAEVVVREGLAAIEKGKCIYVSGRPYRWLAPILQSVWTWPFARRLSGGG